MGKVARQVVEQAGVNVDVLLDKLVRARVLIRVHSWPMDFEKLGLVACGWM